MPRKAIAIAALAVMLNAGVAGAREILGVNLPETREIAGQNAVLNGAGVRLATVLRVKVYVAALYTTKKLSTVEEVMASKGPMRFDFNFLRAFEQKKVVDAWKWQFEQSNEHIYAGLQKDLDAFYGAFGPLKKFGVESIEIEGDETRVFDDGALKLTIKGRDFQKSFLSLWFGSKPVMPELKTAFLGKKG